MMIESELSKLIETVYEQELAILQRRTVEVDQRKSIDLMKLTYKHGLDKKEFSNEEKREAACLEVPAIKACVDELKEYIYQTEVLVIEKNRNIRLIDAMVE